MKIIVNFNKTFHRFFYFMLHKEKHDDGNIGKQNREYFWAL